MPAAWDPPPELIAAEHRLASTDAVYNAVIRTLHALSREDETLRTSDVVFALGAVMGSVAAASGVVWTTPGIAASLHRIADEFERRAATSEPPVERKTLREFFAASRPPAQQ